MALAASLVPSESSANSVQTSRASIRAKNRAEEPLEFELREEMRKELRKSWYISIEDRFGGELVHSWTSGPAPYMLLIDGSGTSTHPIYRSQLLRFCNKPTTLYWAHSAQDNTSCPRFIWGCIYKEWFRCYNQAPRLDFEYFFANPVCITSTGPSTILELLEIHQLFHNRTSLLLENCRRGESEEAHVNAWPDQFKLLPVCRAIIVVLDELVLDDVNKEMIYLDLEVQKQNVLMVRTGNEIGLSEPISFDSIRELALPLARPDVQTYNDIDAIRVPLATAVQFIVNLQQREEAAFPESAPSTAVDQALFPWTDYTGSDSPKITNVDEWVDRIMELADEKGVAKVWRAQEAMLTVQAARRGEQPVESNPPYFGGSWR